MNTNSKRTQAEHARVKQGAAVLAAAEAIGTKPVAEPLRVFRDAYRAYAESEGKVDETAARLATEKLSLRQIGAAHDAAVEALARSLVTDGEPRVNPFGAFGAETPGDIKRMAPAEAAQAVRTLLAGLASHTSLSAATLQAGARVEQATQQVEAALLPFKTRQDQVRAARKMSDAVGRRYDKALSALRYATRAVAVSGAPEIYATLFPTVARIRKPKRAVVESVAASTVAPATTPPQPPTP
ncbi:MAG: hypothetical protein ABI629_18975 [bacterium]